MYFVAIVTFVACRKGGTCKAVQALSEQHRPPRRICLEPRWAERVMKRPGSSKSEKSDITVSSPIHWHPIIQLRAQELLMEVASDLTGQRVQNLSIVQPSCHLSLFLYSVWVDRQHHWCIAASLLEQFWPASAIESQFERQSRSKKIESSC